MAWNDLTMAERGDLMRIFLESGINSIDDMRKYYNSYAEGGSIHIKPSHEGRLTELKERTGKTEAELWAEGNPSVRRMITFARNARGWKHADGGDLDGDDKIYNAGSLPEVTVIADPTRYNSFLQTLPSNLRNTDESEYRMHRYWELNGMPKDFREGVDKGMITKEADGKYHTSSVAEDRNTGIIEFMKYPNHPTINKELEWYYSNDPEAIQFRSNYYLDKISEPYYRYRRKYAEGGPLRHITVVGRATDDPTKADANAGSTYVTEEMNPVDYLQTITGDNTPYAQIEYMPNYPLKEIDVTAQRNPNGPADHNEEVAAMQQKVADREGSVVGKMGNAASYLLPYIGEVRMAADAVNDWTSGNRKKAVGDLAGVVALGALGKNAGKLFNAATNTERAAQSASVGNILFPYGLNPIRTLRKNKAANLNFIQDGYRGLFDEMQDTQAARNMKYPERYIQDPLSLKLPAVHTTLKDFNGDMSFRDKINQFLTTQAYYSPSAGEIFVNPRSLYKSNNDFIGLLGHELNHSFAMNYTPKFKLSVPGENYDILNPDHPLSSSLAAFNNEKLGPLKRNNWVKSPEELESEMVNWKIQNNIPTYVPYTSLPYEQQRTFIFNTANRFAIKKNDARDILNILSTNDYFANGGTLSSF